MRPAPFYRPELDGLRFFAFVAVFITHALPHNEAILAAHHLPQFLATVAKAGAYGVDLFFLLSAYLITSLLLREREQTGKVDVKAFYIRRILRIWPLYFFALGIAAVWGYFDPRLVMPGSYLAAYLLLAGNWMTVMFGPPSSFMSILWSVSVEEQFYLTWPLLLRRLPVRKTAVALIAVAWITRALVLAGTGPHALFPNTLARLDTIALGILLAGIRLNLSIVKRVVLALAGLAFWATATTLPDLFAFPVTTLGSAALFLACLGMELKAGWLIYLGKISYGLYVYHVLALDMAWRYFGHTGLVVISAAFAVTVACAAASYRFLEAPALRLKERYTHIPSRPT